MQDDEEYMNNLYDNAVRLKKRGNIGKEKNHGFVHK